MRKESEEGIFNDGEEVLKIVSNEGSIFKLLGFPSYKCDMFGKEIIFERRIGGIGSYGRAYIVLIEGKEYVVKESDFRDEPILIQKHQLESQLHQNGISFQEALPFQPKDVRNQLLNAKSSETIPFYLPALPCKTNEDIEITPYPNTNRNLFIPKGSYLCKETVSEYIIGLMMGSLARNGSCPHFFEMFSLFACEENIYTTTKDNEPKAYWPIRQYTLMEKLDGSIQDTSNCLSPKIFDNFIGNKRNYAMDSMYVQTLFAIAMYQEKLKISHNDLHTGNVFIQHVDEGTTFKSQKLFNADWFHYRVKGKDIFVPYCAMLAKIGDFGLAVKYKFKEYPMVGNAWIVDTGGYNEDTGVRFAPNVFMPSYDSFYFSVAYAQMFRIDAPSISTISKLVVNCVKFIANLGNNVNINNLFLSLITGSNPVMHQEPSYHSRPYLNKLSQMRSALDTLLGPVFDIYGKKPTQGRVVSLGEIQ